MSPELLRLVRALGHDPDKVEAKPAPGISRRGLLVTWRDSGKVVRFYTDKALRKRRNDAEFLRAWEAAG